MISTNFREAKALLSVLPREDSLGGSSLLARAVSNNFREKNPPIAPDSTFPLSESHLERYYLWPEPVPAKLFELPASLS